MQKNMIQKADSYASQHRHRRIWRKVVGGLACVVVFCTTYALILPAITMEKTGCGIPEHTHTEDCYTQVTTVTQTEPICTLESLNLHEHTEECFDENGEPNCGYSDFVVHEHDSACYDEDGNLWCPLPEIKAHTHDADCYAAAEPVHTHTEDCYTQERGGLICTEEEREGHTHSVEAGCFDENGTLLCQAEEEQGHQHVDDCYSWEQVLSCGLTETETAGEPEPQCGKEEIILHEHSADCFDENDHLICGKQEVLEHVHDQSCFQTVEEPADTEALTCQLEENEEHQHGSLCYGIWELTCGLEEHTHTEECNIPAELTEEEQAQVDEVIALIDALPTQEEIEETLAAFEEAGDEDGYDAYLTETVAGAKAAYEAYAALTEAQQEHVTGVEKLMALEPLWSAQTLENSWRGAISNVSYSDLNALGYRVTCDVDLGAGVAKVLFPTWTEKGDENGNPQDDIIWHEVDFASGKATFYVKVSAHNNESGRYYTHIYAYDADGKDIGFGKIEVMVPEPVIPEGQLSDDSAYVSEISISKYTTGTAPWDSDDTPGNDQGADNMVVRTFDEITYDFKVKYLTYDTSKTFDDARVKLEFVLPVTVDQAEFKQSAMGWMEDPVLTEETRIINGVETECQVLTCYKHLLPSAGHTSVVPGEFGENVTVNVKMMKNGDTLSPIFSAAMEYNTWDGECAEEGHGTEKKSVIAEDIRISAAPKYNVQLKPAFATEARMTFDFTSGAENALNRDAGQVPGRIYTIGITLQLYNDSQDKGMRGVELPQGPITFDIKLRSEFRPNYSTTTGTPTDVTEDYTPLVWSFDAQSKAWNWDRDVSMTSYSYAFGSQTPLNRPDSQSNARDYSCYDGGGWSAVQTGDTVTLTITDYKFDGLFPCVGVDESPDKATFYNKETGLRNIGCFSAAELYIVQPFQNNKTYADVLNDFSGGGQHDQNSGTCLDGSFLLVVEDVNLTAASTSGQSLPSAPSSNANQGGSNPAAKQDDSVTYTVAMKRPGGYEQRNLYSAKDRPSMDDIFGVNEGKPGSCATNGNDWTVIGTEFGLTFGGYAQTSGEDANKMCAAKWLLKFDPEAIELIDGNSQSPAVANYDFQYLYAVKPDGTGWASDAEMKQTAILELNYYATIAEAKAHGQIVGVMAEAMPKTTVEALPTGNVLTYFCQNARVKSDLSLSNRRFIITEESIVWTVDDFEAAHGQIPTLLGNNPANPTALPQQSYYVNSPSVYGNGDGVYDQHTGDYTQGDTLLVLAYKASIYKKLEQMEPDSTEAKYTYNLDSDQRVADFVLDPSVDYGGLQPEEKQTTTVTIVDTLPKYLTYLPGSSHFGGTYTQSSRNGGTKGTITDGVLREPDSVVKNADGTQTLTWVISDVVIGEKMDLIHYSVNLGTKGQEATDVPKGTTDVENVVEISAVGDDRLHSTANGNYAVAGLQMTKGETSSYGKYSTTPVVEPDGEITYVIYYDNNSSVATGEIILLDTMPKDGYFGNDYSGTYTVKSWKLDTTKCTGTSFKLYYTLDDQYAGKTIQEISKDEILTWNSVTIGADGVVSDMNGQTPVAWALVGSLGANGGVYVDLTIKLIPGESNDKNNVYHNTFSHGNTTMTTEEHSVRRTLEGLTWLDDNADGIQNEDNAHRLDGVKVALLKLKEGGDPTKESDYEPFHYQNNMGLNEVKVTTGHQVSVQSGGYDSFAVMPEYKPGCYKFTDLPAGTYAVRFEQGGYGGAVSIGSYIASPPKRGNDDTQDSDGIATYTSDHSTLKQTIILGIDMPKAEDMQVKLYESKYHDSGFYEKGHELPQTGGFGTTPYTIGGLLLTGAGLLLLYKKRRKEDFASF